MIAPFIHSLSASIIRNCYCQISNSLFHENHTDIGSASYLHGGEIRTDNLSWRMSNWNIKLMRYNCTGRREKRVDRLYVITQEAWPASAVSGCQASLSPVSSSGLMSRCLLSIISNGSKIQVTMSVMMSHPKISSLSLNLSQSVLH